MTEPEPSRVRFFTGQFLRTTDLTDEQAYHLAAQRRHNVSHHSWGIISGLDLTVDKETGSFQLGAGVAIDGYGRELVVSRARNLAGSSFEDKGSDTLDVWLVHSIDERSSVSDRGTCTESRGDRSVVSPRVDMLPPSDESSDRRHPLEDTSGDDPFLPHRTAPDDPFLRWPVFLGQIIRAPLDPLATAFEYAVSYADRPMGGLIGESVVAPSGTGSMLFGQESHPYLFALHVRDQPHANNNSNNGANGGEDAVAGTDQSSPNDRSPVLAIDRNGKIQIRGETKVTGNLSVVGDGIKFLEQIAPRDGGDVEHPVPWQIYHSFGPAARNDVPPTTVRGGGVNDRVHELRVAMPNAEDTNSNRVVIGFWSPDNEFVSCLTVETATQDPANAQAARGTVTVHGNLTVTGNFDATDGEAESPVSAEVQQLLASVFQTGLTGSGLAGQVQTLTSLLATDVGREIAAPILVGQPSGREELAEAFATGEGDKLAHLLQVMLGLGGDGLSGPENVTDAIVRIITTASQEEGQQAVAKAFATDDASPPLADVLTRLVILPAADTPPPVAGLGVVQETIKELVIRAPANEVGEEQGRNAIVGGIKRIADDITVGGALEIFGEFVGARADYITAFLAIVHAGDFGQTASAGALIELEGGLQKIADELPNEKDDVVPLASKLLSSNNRTDAIIESLAGESLNRFVERLSGGDKLDDLVIVVFEDATRTTTVAQSLPTTKAKLTSAVQGLAEDATRAKNFVSALIEFKDAEGEKGLDAIVASLSKNDGRPTPRVTTLGEYIRDNADAKVTKALIEALGGTAP